MSSDQNGEKVTPGVVQRPSAQLVDPDPFTIATVSMTAAALVLQLLQTWKAFSPAPPAPNAGALSVRTSNLGQLEQSVEKLEADLRQIHRTIDRGSRNSNAEFFDAPYRLATTSLNLDHASHQQLQHQLGTGLGDLGNVSQWINHVIRDDPDLAVRLGGRIAGGLENTAEILNGVMAEGGPNRVVIAEARQALELLAKAIEFEIRNDGN